MKRIRRAGLAAVMALALTAVFSASASASEFYAEKYPVAVTGEGESGTHFIKTNYWNELSCGAGPALTAELKEESSSLTVTPGNVNCGGYTLKMEGCKFTIDAGAPRPDGTYVGSLDIGPSECGPIKYHSYCTISIPAQEDLLVSLAKTKDGLTLSSKITGMKYTLSGLCGSQAGTYENGEYSGIWKIKGGEGIKVRLKSSPWTGWTAEQYPATITGSAESPFEFLFEERSGQCGEATFTGELKETSPTLSLAPSFSECETMGLNSPINVNGCVYVLHVNGEVDLDCPEGKVLEINVGPSICDIDIPSQKGIMSLGGEWFQTKAGIYGVKIDWDGVENFTYKFIKTFFLCPVNNEERSDGVFGGTTALEAVNSKGASIGIW